MRTFISTENPFGANRYGFLWEKLSLFKHGRHLDYGAYDGNVLIKLALSRVIKEGVGVDVNKNIVNSSTNLPENISLITIETGSKLPFEEKTFDTVSILDVVEHIHDQKLVLNELNRILNPGGKIIVTVPRKYIFSFLDVGNFKFIFPRLHKIAYQLKYSKEEYHKRYVECANGLFGDIEVEKKWHQHFSNKELADLLRKCGFTNVEFDESGLFARPLIMLSLLFPFAKSFINRIIEIDYKKFGQMNLFCMAEKQL